MAIKLDYVVRETATNLTRNVTLTLASILTVVVSLTLFGSAFMLNQGVNNANDRFKGGIEFIVFLQPELHPGAEGLGPSATSRPTPTSQRGPLRRPGRDLRGVQADLRGADAAHRDGVARGPARRRSGSSPVTKDPDVVQALGDTFQDKAGVYEVVFAFEVVKAIQETFNKIGVRFLIASGLLLLAAGLLIVNTIRMAMFARRREIEVMKLVGATNWFIRVPVHRGGHHPDPDRRRRRGRVDELRDPTVHRRALEGEARARSSRASRSPTATC